MEDVLIDQVVMVVTRPSDSKGGKQLGNCLATWECGVVYLVSDACKPRHVGEMPENSKFEKSNKIRPKGVPGGNPLTRGAQVLYDLVLCRMQSKLRAAIASTFNKGLGIEGTNVFVLDGAKCNVTRL
ncbi:hypothetical protein Sjap_020588 [Stephania japonica]|uniref:Uncharacterized protein n=1 Tax=Stephania japonica TaxID=461633 RepID=A0AAP0I0T2_9MAGN